MTLDKIETQINVEAKKGLAVGINNGVINYDPQKTVSSFKEKLMNIKNESLNDSSFKDYIDALNHYIMPAKYSPRDLRTKLTNAGRNFEVEEAIELKASFTKKLVKNNFSESAQDCYVHILTELKTKYDEKVRPLLLKKAPLEEIETMVAEVVTFMYDELRETVFEQNKQEIKGMLYFLTGNCHIEWSY